LARPIAGWRLFAVPLLLALVVGGVVVTMQPAVGPDPWRGLLAVEQNLQGRSASLADIVVADPNDLARDRHEDILWWPPGQQTVIYGLRRAGVSIGGAIKLVVTSSWLIGLIAWAGFFYVSLGARPLTSALLVVLICHRTSHSQSWIYFGGDAMMWALCPVAALLYLLAWKATGPMAWTSALLSGAVCGLMTFFKYSAFVLGAGFLVAGLIAARRHGDARRLGIWLLGAVATVGWWFVGSGTRWPDQTPASALVDPSVTPILVWNAAGPFMAIGDVYEIASSVRRVLNFAAPVADVIVPLSLGVLALLTVWWITRIRGAENTPAPVDRDARTLALTVAATTSLGLATLMLRGGIISFEGRHQQYSGFLLLPFFAAAIASTISTRLQAFRMRAPALICGAVFFVAPAVYGAVLLTHQAIALMRISSGTGPEGVRLDWTAAGAGGRAFVQEIRHLPFFDSALLVTTTPEIALSFPDRQVLFVLDRGDDDRWQFHGGQEGGVLLIAPPAVAENDLAIARNSFVDVPHWTRIPLSSVSGVHVWRGQ